MPQRCSLLVCVVTVAASVGVELVSRRLPAPTPTAGRIVLGLGVTALLLAALLAHPVRRFDAFKQPPATLQATPANFVQAHLLSGSGSGRWQFWQAAIKEFESRRVLGRGAGSYAEWWAQHGVLAVSIQDAHSLYLQTMGELGLVGIAILGALLVVALWLVLSTCRSDDDREADVAASAGAAFLAFLLAAAIDWVWQLPAITATAVVALGVIAAIAPARPPVRRTLTRRGRAALRTVAVAGVVLVALAEVVPLLTQARLGESERAARRGDVGAAMTAARAAVRLEPWGSSPYLQLALVDEQAGRLGDANADIGRALARDPRSWQLELIATRLETESGAIAAARRSYARARALDPRSPLFANHG